MKSLTHMDPAKIEILNQSLATFDGGPAMIWDTMRWNSAIVLAVESPDDSERRAYLDCVSCRRTSYVPSWKPSRIRCAINEDGDSILRITDNAFFDVECKTARLTMGKSDGRLERHFSTPAGLLTQMELIAKICRDSPESFSAISAYYYGYSQALETHMIPWDNAKPSLAAFREWIKLKLGWNKTTAGWEMPVKSEFLDDSTAAKEFCRLHADFCREFNEQDFPDPPPRHGYQSPGTS